MYLDYFGFKEEPFSITPNPRFLFLSRQHEEAIGSLQYGITHRKGFMAVFGNVGTGKTTLCRELVRRLDKNVDTSVIFNPMLSIRELLEAINDDFGNFAGRDDTIKDQIDALNAFLLRRLRWNKNAAVIIDEAQHLSYESFEMLRMLSNLETEDKKLLQIVFIGQQELGIKLKREDLRQLNQRIVIRCMLGALSYHEMCEYIAHRLSIAQGTAALKFKEDSLREIFEHSSGIPRLINTICDRALLEAYSDREFVITKKMVRNAVGEINGWFETSSLAQDKRGKFFKNLFGYFKS